jgi:hypothetical protein
MVPTKELKKLKAFHNKPQLKKDMVAEILWHQKQDMIIKGTYATTQSGKWRGCAVGCSVHSYNLKYGEKINTGSHAAYQTKLGIPESLAKLEDSLFERMPQDAAMKWPAEFMKAINVGSNLSMVAPKFIAGTLRDLVKIKEVKDDKAALNSIVRVAKLWEQVISGKTVKAASWKAASSAANSAAYSAAYSAAWSTAYSAARSAAYAASSAAYSAASSAANSAAYAANSAAWSTAYSAAYSAARSAAAYKMSRRLLKLLRAAK